MNGCHNAIEYMYQYIDEELTPARRARIKMHLKRCDVCPDAFDFEQQLKAKIHERVKSGDLCALRGSTGSSRTPTSTSTARPSAGRTRSNSANSRISTSTNALVSSPVPRRAQRSPLLTRSWMRTSWLRSNRFQRRSACPFSTQMQRASRTRRSPRYSTFR